jgi:hypothetical protein
MPVIMYDYLVIASLLHRVALLGFLFPAFLGLSWSKSFFFGVAELGGFPRISAISPRGFLALDVLNLLWRECPRHHVVYVHERRVSSRISMACRKVEICTACTARQMACATTWWWS